MIVITGATGKLGSAVVENLLQKMPAGQIGVSVRDANKAKAFADKGVRVREASYDNAEALEKAFEGADQVLIVSNDTMGPESVQLNKNAIDAAVKAGAKRVLYTSHMGANKDSKFQACVDHAQIEEYLGGLDIPWTSLRHGFYASSAVQFAEYGIKGGDIAVPADGPVSWTTHADLAAADAAILAGEVTFDGPTPALTSSETGDFADIARIASQIENREITRTVMDDDEWAAQLASYGVPEFVAKQLVGIFEAARDGEFEATDPTLERIIGRPAQSISDAVKEHLAQ